MLEPYADVFKRIENKVSKKKLYIDCVTSFKSKNLEKCSLDDLMNFDTKNIAEISYLRRILCLVKYSKKASNKFVYAEMSDFLVSTLEKVPKDRKSVMNPFLIKAYFDGFLNEIKNEDIYQLMKCINVFYNLKVLNIDIELFKTNFLSTILDKLKTSIMNVNKELTSPKIIGKIPRNLANNKIDELSYCLNTLSEVKKLFSDFYYRFSSLVDTVKASLDSLEVSFESRVNSYNEAVMNSFINLKELFNNLTIDNELSLKKRCLKVENNLGKSLVSNFDTLVTTLKNYPYNQIDISKYSFKTKLPTDFNHSEFSFEINYYFCPNSRDIAIAFFEIQEYETSKTKKKIEILKNLPATPTNCFLNFTEYKLPKNTISLVIEFHKHTLHDILTKMKREKKEFTEKNLFYFAKELISAYSLLEENGITSSYIKTKNILVTSNWVLKIFDQFIPELATIDTSQNKADSIPIKDGVFSLGYVLLQIYTLEELEILNHQQNISILIKKANQIKYPWLKSLINKMLSVQSNCSFKECLRFIDESQTKINDDKQQESGTLSSKQGSKKDSMNETHERQQDTINFNSLKFINTMFRYENQYCIVSTYTYFCEKLQSQILLKIYEIKESNLELGILEREVLIYKTLSRISNPRNCFLKVYGSCIDSNKMYLSLEYHDINFNIAFSHMKSMNRLFEGKTLYNYAKILIKSYVTMQSNGFYHCVINLNNISFTNNWELKITNYGEIESKFLKQNDQFIQINVAPGVQNTALNDKSFTSKKDRGKANVFSLGLVLLQMYYLEDMSTLNFTENNQKLIEKVKEVNYQWLKELLEKMLNADFENRANFKNCYKFLSKIQQF